MDIPIAISSSTERRARMSPPRWRFLVFSRFCCHWYRPLRTIRYLPPNCLELSCIGLSPHAMPSYQSFRVAQAAASEHLLPIVRASCTVSIDMLLSLMVRCKMHLWCPVWLLLAWLNIIVYHLTIRFLVVTLWKPGYATEWFDHAISYISFFCLLKVHVAANDLCRCFDSLNAIVVCMFVFIGNSLL